LFVRECLESGHRELIEYAELERTPQGLNATNTTILANR